MALTNPAALAATLERQHQATNCFPTTTCCFHWSSILRQQVNVSKLPFRHPMLTEFYSQMQENQGHHSSMRSNMHNRGEPNIPKQILFL